MEKMESPEIINVGSGQDLSIKELAEKIAAATGYRGNINWDSTKPDGMPRKCLDISKIENLGFVPQISLDEGIQMMIAEYRHTKAAPATV
jgi:GDP-L-fucose synthase